MTASSLPSPLTTHSGELRFFFEGEDYFSALEVDLESAHRSIEIESYYFASDELGWHFAKLLSQKAKQGVTVRLIVDAFGCSGTSIDIFDAMELSGVEVKVYNPVIPLWRHWGRRDHRKTVIVDGKVGFLGGYNFGCEYSRKYSGERGWRDTGVRIIRPNLVKALGGIFEESWRDHPSFREFIKTRRRRPRFDAGDLHIIANYGWGRRGWIRQEYLSAIVHARESIEITNPYFIPDPGILWALRKAARRGVAVSILTAGLTDVRAARWAGHATYSRLLKAGVRIFEYQKRVIHAKCAVIDDHWFTVGTANLDHLSLFKNLEVNLFGSDVEASQALHRQFECDLGFALEIKREQWRKRSWLSKLRERIFFWFREWL